MQAQLSVCSTRPQPRRCSLRARASAGSPALRTVVPAGGTVLVAGATGGVGQLVVAGLLSQGYRVRALVRDAARAQTTLGTVPDDRLTLAVADLRDGEALKNCDALRGLDGVVCCTGTTAFPSARWEGGNDPKNTDELGVRNLAAAVAAGSPSLARFVLVSSVGVTRTNAFPYLLLNLFGVLTHKAQGELAVRAAGFPWSVLRPGRLTDGPYTSYDLNTLLQATSGTRRAPVLALDDSTSPQESSRLVVAAAAVAALRSEQALGRCFDVGSKEGDGPSGEGAQASWDKLFQSARRA